MNDKETLRLYLAGGKPEGSYLNSVKVLSRLYTTYKTDLANDNITSHGTKYSDLYRKMILSLSLTASGKNYFFFDGTQVSDPVTRYQIYKDLHLHKGQDQELIENEIFESLTVEEMRFVMNTIIDDEEIVWLNHYVRNDKMVQQVHIVISNIHLDMNIQKINITAKKITTNGMKNIIYQNTIYHTRKAIQSFGSCLRKEQFVVDFPRQEVVSGVHIKDFQIHVSASRLIVHLFITHRIPTEWYLESWK